MSANSRNLAVTFINKLVDDLQQELSDCAEVKTFHAFCMKLLYEINGRIVVFGQLTKIIEKDAMLLGYQYHDMDYLFLNLKDDEPALRFYLARGDYYSAVAFNDSVYRLYRYVREQRFELPEYDLVVVDEFQDFNLLEVAFIDELQKKSPILIVGDDDQAVYSKRCSSPDYLREKYYSGDYEIFELPFCSRCPRVVVEGTNAFMESSIRLGSLANRIPRQFVPYLEDKKYENAAYPKIITAQVTNISTLSKYISHEIAKIPQLDISESHEKHYPTVLIVGQKQYLNPILKSLRQSYTNINEFSQSPDFTQDDAYKFILRQPESNLGWRLLAGLELPDKDLAPIIRSTLNGTSMRDLLTPEFIIKHEKALHLSESKQTSDTIIELPTVAAKEPEIDNDLPSILLTSFEGCKGLSAGHVFIVGLNNGEIPKTTQGGPISDIEICKLIVAMTRTRKQLHLLANKWQYNPKTEIQRNKSIFLQRLPPQFVRALGTLAARDIP